MKHLVRIALMACISYLSYNFLAGAVNSALNSKDFSFSVVGFVSTFIITAFTYWMMRTFFKKR